MRLMVTGGCGFIGSAVVRLALARGHQVANIDNAVPSSNKIVVGKRDNQSIV